MGPRSQCSTKCWKLSMKVETVMTGMLLLSWSIYQEYHSSCFRGGSLAQRNFIVHGAKVSCKVMDVHHRRSPLVQGGLEIPCQVLIVEMEMTDKNSLAIAEYNRQTPCIWAVSRASKRKISRWYTTDITGFAVTIWRRTRLPLRLKHERVRARVYLKLWTVNFNEYCF